jgi:SAM-dependent methyltransferase
MDAAYAAAGRTSADYWTRRMSGRSNLLSQIAGTEDPLLAVMRPYLSPPTTLLDIGAGAGRYALTLAREVASVAAVEPDRAMLDRLEAGIRENGQTNVRVIARRWQDVEGEQADVVLCAHVLYPIEDASAFLLSLDGSARSACFIAMRDVVPEPEPLGRLWLRFHGNKRRLQPGYMDALNILYEIGIHANLRVFSIPGPTWTFGDLDEAVTFAREHLILRNEAAIDAVLRRDLESALTPMEGGTGLTAGRTWLGVIWWVKNAV